MASAERRFRFRLALALHCTVSELGRRMSWVEYQEWRVFDAIEPFGDHRSDWQAAHIAHAALSPHVKGTLKVRDLLPFDERRFEALPDEATQWEQWDRALDRAAASAQQADGME